MRTIKFRGKPVKSRFIQEDDFVYGNLSAEERGVYRIVKPMDVVFSDSYRVNPKTIGQFTGFVDKNGEEIYEDDIFRWSVDNNLYRVGYCCGMFVASEDLSDTELLGGSPLHKFLEIRENCEIIGNIHDNPELIKK